MGDAPAHRWGRAARRAIFGLVVCAAIGVGVWSFFLKGENQTGPAGEGLIELLERAEQRVAGVLQSPRKPIAAVLRARQKALPDKALEVRVLVNDYKKVLQEKRGIKVGFVPPPPPASKPASKSATAPATAPAKG